MPSVLLATGGYDHKLRLWEASNGNCYQQLQFGDSQVNCLEISPSKKYIVAAGNPHTRLYDLAASDTNPLRALEGHTHNVTAVGFQKDTKWMFSGSDDGTLRIWDLRSEGTARDFGTCQREYDNGGGINAVALHPNQGELIAGDQNGNIRVFDLTQNKMSHEQQSNVGSPVRSISIAADASLAATAHDNGVCVLWKLPTDSQTVSHFEERRIFQAHDTYALKCKLSPDLGYLATSSADATVKLWNVGELLPDAAEDSPGSGSDSAPQKQPPPRVEQQPQASTVLKGHQRWVWDIAFSADSAYLVSASSDQTAKLWDLEKGEDIRDYKGHTKAVTAVSLDDVPDPSPPARD